MSQCGPNGTKAALIKRNRFLLWIWSKMWPGHTVAAKDLSSSKKHQGTNYTDVWQYYLILQKARSIFFLVSIVRWSWGFITQKDEEGTAGALILFWKQCHSGQNTAGVKTNGFGMQLRSPSTTTVLFPKTEMGYGISSLLLPLVSKQLGAIKRNCDSAHGVFPLGSVSSASCEYYK